jgi:hypothetical protein
MKGRLRIVFKSDFEAGTDKGARMYAEHFESPVVELIAGTARETERLLPAAQTLRVTEGWRPSIRPTGRDLHTALKAIDFTIVFEGGVRATEAQYRMVAEAVRAKVGDAGYDFAVHGEGFGVHIHAEYDPK